MKRGVRASRDPEVPHPGMVFYNDQWRSPEAAEHVKRLQRQLAKAWSEANPEKVREYGRLADAKRKDSPKRKAQKKIISRSSSLRIKYGITQEQYDEMVRRQNGLCAICAHAPSKKILVVDHDHQTGAIRGLLCDGCNVGLGRFGDNPGLLAAALRYLERK
jgi:hypothetical protein